MEDAEVMNPELDEAELSGGEYEYGGSEGDESAEDGAEESAEQEGAKKRKESPKAAENRRLKEQKREEEQKKKLEERREEARKNEEKAQKNGRMHWYFIQTYSGYELRVQKALKELLSNSPRSCRTSSPTSWSRPRRSLRSRTASSAEASASSIPAMC